VLKVGKYLAKSKKLPTFALRKIRQNLFTISKAKSIMNAIQTKYGEFNAVDNNNGGVSLFIGDKKIIEFPNVAWWNLDGIENAIEKNIELINKRIEEHMNTLEVTRDNAAEVLERLINVLGNEQKGFYSSRLKQCLNKLKAA